MSWAVRYLDKPCWTAVLVEGLFLSTRPTPSSLSKTYLIACASVSVSVASCLCVSVSVCGFLPVCQCQCQWLLACVSVSVSVSVLSCLCVSVSVSGFLPVCQCQCLWLLACVLSGDPNIPDSGHEGLWSHDTTQPQERGHTIGSFISNLGQHFMCCPPKMNCEISICY